MREVASTLFVDDCCMKLYTSVFSVQIPLVRSIHHGQYLMGPCFTLILSFSLSHSFCS